MADNVISTPAGFGGIMRYNEEFPSRFKISPTHVIAFIIAIIIFVAALNILAPIAPVA